VSPVLRPGPIAQARFEALRILVRVEGDRAFADIALEHALDRAALDPRDAALCTEIVYGTL
jgi:16S rRNA (cytosine967-C5)-methyltransferase